MPTPARIDALQALLDTRTPLTLIETHDEPRVLALFVALNKANGRELWAWSASSGLRVVQGLKLQLLDLPSITRGIKEVALRFEHKALQLVLVGHDIDLPEELAPLAGCFDIGPMTLERVKEIFNDELKRRRESRKDVTGFRATLDSLLRHMVGLPQASVRRLARLVLGDGEVNAADLARVLAVKHDLMGGAELLMESTTCPRSTRWPAWPRSSAGCSRGASRCCSARRAGCRRRAACCCWARHRGGDCRRALRGARRRQGARGAACLGRRAHRRRGLIRRKRPAAPAP